MISNRKTNFFIVKLSGEPYFQISIAKKTTNNVEYMDNTSVRKIFSLPSTIEKMMDITGASRSEEYSTENVLKAILLLEIPSISNSCAFLSSTGLALLAPRNIKPMRMTFKSITSYPSNTVSSLLPDGHIRGPYSQSRLRRIYRHSGTHYRHICWFPA